MEAARQVVLDGDLASHVVNMLEWTDVTMEATEFDLDSVTPEEMNQAAKTRAQLLAWFDANAAARAHGVGEKRRRLPGAVDAEEGRRCSSRCRATPASAASA